MSSKAGHKGGGPIPDKLFFRIGEVSRIIGVAPSVLRYWEGEFPQIRPRKGSGGQRVYRREEVEQILAIKIMLHDEGYTIAGARRRLKRGMARSRQAQPAAAQNAGGAGTKSSGNAREGLRELLRLMDNTDALRANTGSDSGRGAAR